MEKLKYQVETFIPCNEQEMRDKELLLRWINSGVDILTRANAVAHLTASAWVMSPDRKHVLMAYHNLYNSWAWLGGHADGDPDLLAVALREATEESGVQNVRPLSTEIASLDILPVWGHTKRGKYVASHQHLNVTYLLVADESDALTIRAEENSGVAWLPADRLLELTNEWEMDHVYLKLLERAKALL